VDATHVYTEVNLRDPKVISAIRKCRQLPANQTIKDVLPEKTYTEFKRVLEKFKVSRKKWLRKLLKSDFALRHLENSGYYDIYNDFSSLKPMWLTSTILQQWNRFYVKNQLRGPSISLDGELINLAADTYRGGIEEVSSHCDPMDNLEIEKVSYIICILSTINIKQCNRISVKLYPQLLKKEISKNHQLKKQHSAILTSSEGKW
jgi:hypothetical protein